MLTDHKPSCLDIHVVYSLLRHIIMSGGVEGGVVTFPLTEKWVTQKTEWKTIFLDLTENISTIDQSSARSCPAKQSIRDFFFLKSINLAYDILCSELPKPKRAYES